MKKKKYNYAEPTTYKGFIAVKEDDPESNSFDTSRFYYKQPSGTPPRTWEEIGWTWQKVELRVKRIIK